jgi:predicted acylesterase/phospholipase RssA
MRMTLQQNPKRAITLAGGGPTAGLHLGVLKYFAEKDIRFQVWALSCIGAWVGIVYNQFEKGEAVEKTTKFFKEGVFRDDLAYTHFPINSVFGPDWSAYAQALISYLGSLDTYTKEVPFLLGMPKRISDSVRQAMLLLTDATRQTPGDVNQWILNHVLAVNPLVRLLTSMMFLSPLNGLAKIYYPDSSFLKAIDFERLRGDDKPFIFHNAWNLTKQQLELFSNRPVENRDYDRINAASLCACSALPFIEPTVEMNGDTYCEGALIDTVNFKNLIEDHPDLDEIWVSRIVDARQIRAPKNLTDGLGNLCQLFASTVGVDDVELFMYHVREKKNWGGTVVEIQVPNVVQVGDKSEMLNFDWSHANFENCMDAGYRAAGEAYVNYESAKLLGGQKPEKGEIRLVQVDPSFGRRRVKPDREVHHSP